MKFTLFALTAYIFLLHSTTSFSHHGRSNFLYDDTVSVEGEVTYFRWKYPHVYMEIQATKENNENKTWLIEGGTPTALKKMGWKEDSIEVGDNVVVVGNPNRDPEKTHLLLDHIVRADGEIFYISSSKRTAGTVKIIPATSNASEDNLPSENFSGTWARGRTNHVTSDYFVPPEEGSWPLTERGKMELARFDDRENPGYTCAERGLPFYTLGPYSFSWKRYEGRIEIVSQYSILPRTIYLNQDQHPDDLEPSVMGHSIGHIDEDGVLLVDIAGFPADLKWAWCPV